MLHSVMFFKVAFARKVPDERFVKNADSCVTLSSSVHGSSGIATF